MARGVNKVILVGNLGNDPESRQLPNGDAVCNMTVATSDTWKDKNSGEQREKTEWHRVVAFRRLAEIMGQYLHKGSKVYIEGKLQTRMWEKDGQKHYTTEIVASEMQMLDSKGGGGGGAMPSTGEGSSSNSQSQDFGPPPAEDFDDDIPF